MAALLNKPGRTRRPRRVDVPRCPGDKRTMVWVQRNGGGPDHLTGCPCYRLGRPGEELEKSCD
jgi:hypothetical protein